MTSETVILIGSLFAIFWGFVHMIILRDILAGFGELSKENRLLLVYSWITEGITLLILGAIPLLVLWLGEWGAVNSLLIVRVVAGSLVISAVWTIFTGYKSSQVPMKFNPFIKLNAALLLTAATFMV